MKVSVNDFEVKCLKTFTGMEGFGYNAKLYLKGKQIGTANDYGNGEPVSIDIDSKSTDDIKKALSEYDVPYLTKGKDESTSLYLKLENIIEKLILLKDTEKILHKEQKKRVPSPVTMCIFHYEPKKCYTTKEYLSCLGNKKYVFETTKENALNFILQNDTLKKIYKNSSWIELFSEDEDFIKKY